MHLVLVEHGYKTAGRSVVQLGRGPWVNYCEVYSRGDICANKKALKIT